MEHLIITIGRQYGSGGHAIGKETARILNIPFYDRELIELSSEKSGIEAGTLSLHDERTNPASLFKTKSGGAGRHGAPIGETLFQTQCQVIRELAQKSSCVIIGRCADYVLRDDPGLFSVFICAPVQQRIARIMERNRMSQEDAAQAVERVSRQRQTYYNHHTGKIWGDPGSYRLVMDSSLLGIQGTAASLSQQALEFQRLLS